MKAKPWWKDGIEFLCQPDCGKCEGNTNGLPCDLDKCKPKMNNLPACQMMNYKPLVPTPNSRVGKCNYPK